jgi:hypothetical protein
VAKDPSYAAPSGPDSIFSAITYAFAPKAVSPDSFSVLVHAFGYGSTAHGEEVQQY